MVSPKDPMMCACGNVESRMAQQELMVAWCISTAGPGLLGSGTRNLVSSTFNLGSLEKTALPHQFSVLTTSGLRDSVVTTADPRLENLSLSSLAAAGTRRSQRALRPRAAQCLSVLQDMPKHGSSFSPYATAPFCPAVTFRPPCQL